MKKLVELTREDVVNCGSNSELATLLGLSYEDTTIGMNGYPECVNQAIVSGSIIELDQLADKLEALGFDVERLELHKRDGWHLWNRTSMPFFQQGQYQNANERDFTFDYKAEWDDEKAKENIFQAFFSERDPESFGEMEAIIAEVNEYYEEMSNYDEDTRFFFSETDMSIMYGISSDAAGYSYDTHSYQLAIRISDFEIDE